MTRILSFLLIASPLALAACTTGHADPGLAIPVETLPAQEMRVDLADELALAEVELASVRAELRSGLDASAELEALRHDLAAAQRRVGALGGQVAQKDARITNLNAQLQRSRANAVEPAELQRSADELAAARGEVERLRARMNRVRNRNDQLRANLNRADRQIAEQTQRNREQRQQLRSMERSMRNLEQSVVASRGLERRLRTANTEIRALQAALDSANRHLAAERARPAATAPRVASVTPSRPTRTPQKR